MRTLKELAEYLETSLEIIQAICLVFKTKNEDSIRIYWEHPSEKESQMILEMAWELTSEDILFWGKGNALERSDYEVQQ